MPAPASTEPVVKEIHIDAPPESVFSYFTEPEKLTRWLCTEATTDPRPGGIIRQTHGGTPEESHEPYLMRGEFVEVDFPTRVVFTWGYANSELGVEPGTTRVEVDLVRAGSGTDLRLVHSDITEALPSDAYSAGWDKTLARLAAVDFES